jgi:hypothetical protein
MVDLMAQARHELEAEQLNSHFTGGLEGLLTTRLSISVARARYVIRLMMMSGVLCIAGTAAYASYQVTGTADLWAYRQARGAMRPGDLSIKLRQARKQGVPTLAEERARREKTRQRRKREMHRWLFEGTGGTGSTHQSPYAVLAPKMNLSRRSIATYLRLLADAGHYRGCQEGGYKITDPDNGG